MTVNLALIPHFVREGWSTVYIGSIKGIENQLVSQLDDVRYYSIATGKLRRYLDWQNVKDPFRVVKGLYQAYRIIKKEKPNLLFSKGGFVSVPVVIGAWLNKVPIIIHESDLTSGMANQITAPFARMICTTFPETSERLGDKCRYVGPVIRESLKNGNAQRGRKLTGFTADKPVILIMGGSLGSHKINQAVRENIADLTQTFQLVHLCGRGQLDSTYDNHPFYRQYEYVNEELRYREAVKRITGPVAPSDA